MTWNPEALPNASTRQFVVTGGNAGIGYFAAEQLASTGARVIIAARSVEKAELAMQAIRSRLPQARLAHHELDLSSIESARESGAQLHAHGPIDGLLLNAAALTQPRRHETADGHELVWGTNYLGNAAFVARAFPALAQGPASRIVTMGSVAHRFGKVDPALPTERSARYSGLATYGASKQAQMHFALELHRRLTHSHPAILSLLAHPGVPHAGLTPDRAPAFTQTPSSRRAAQFVRPFVQGKDRAAWPAVRALLDPAAAGGQLWGPGSATGSRPPKLHKIGGALTDTALAAQLWERTSELLNLKWNELGVSAPATS